MEESKDVNIRTFNTAKEFAEKILFPLMFDFKKYQRQANFGSHELNESLELSEEIREIQRFNGLKACIETVHDLLYAISSTVKLKGNKEEIKMLSELLLTTDKIKNRFYRNREKFFYQEYKNQKSIEVLDRKYFEIMKDIIDVCYVNTEILMTRNKLLFDDSKNDFVDDQEIREQILKEYADG